MKTALPVLALLLCLALFPRFTASAMALVVLGGLLVTSGAFLLSCLFAPPRPR